MPSSCQLRHRCLFQIAALLGLALLGGLLAGCGSGSGGAGSGGSTQAAAVYRWGNTGNKGPGGGGGGTSGHRSGGKHSSTAGSGGKHGSTAGGGSGKVPAARTPTRVTGVPGTVVQISTSNSDSYALTSAGTVWAWGSGSGGELGNGDLRASTPAVEVDFPSGTRIRSLPDPMPFDGGLAIDTEGGVWGWGNDTFHQLCLSSTSAVDKPQLLPLKDVTQAVGASRHTLFDSDGKLEGCGWNKNGDLGDGRTSGDQATPTAVQGLPSTPVHAITAAWGDEGVLLSDGSVWDWGWNGGGQVGDGTTTDATRAVRVSLPEKATQISEGGSVSANGTTLAILSDGSTWVWGNGRDGQIGDGATSDALRPVALSLPAGVRFSMVNAGGETCFALDQQGRLWAWGGNGQGEVGSGSSQKQVTRPVDVGLHLTQVSSTASNVAGYARSS